MARGKSDGGYLTSISKRKLARKKSRATRKQRKREHFSHGKAERKPRLELDDTSTDTLVRKNEVKKMKVKVKETEAEQSRKRRRVVDGERQKTRFEQYLAEQKLVDVEDTSRTTKFVSPEDAEIEYLERKLGMGKDRKGENRKGSKKKLKSALKKDGIDPELWNFLESLDKTPEEEDMLERDGTETSNASTASSNESSDEELVGINARSEGGDVLADSRTERIDNSNTVFIPKENIYGQDVSAEERLLNAGQEDRGEKKNSNSRLFKRRTAVTSLSDTEMKLRRRLNGLVNRLTDDNIHPITTQVVALYKCNSRQNMNQALYSVIISSLSRLSGGGHDRISAKISMLFAAMITALSIQIAPEIASAMLEHLALKFTELRTNCAKATRRSEAGDSTKNPAPDQSRSENMLNILIFLYLFNVTTSKLLFTICNSFFQAIASQKGSGDEADRGTYLGEQDVKLVSLIIKEVGHKLRRDEPGRLKTLIEDIQSSSVPEKAATALEGKTYREFLLDEMFMLKNNRQNSANMLEKSKKLRSWIKLLQSQNSDGALAPFDLSYEDLRHAEKNGRWWIVGSSWAGKHSAQGTSAANKSIKDRFSEARKTQIRGPMYSVLASAPTPVLDQARKSRMNTDIRKAIFVILFTSEDEIDAFRRLTGLNLKDVQQREYVYVILRVCSLSRAYNPFYAMLLTRLCEHNQQHRFTLQLGFWDSFKQLSDMTSTRLINLSKLLSEVTLNSTLSLSVLKVIDFDEVAGRSGTEPGRSEALLKFFNSFFYQLIMHGISAPDQPASSTVGMKTVLKTFRRLSLSKDWSIVAEGIQFFLQHYMLKEFEDEAINTVFQKRLGQTRRFLSTLVMRMEDAQDSASEMNELASEASEIEE